ncbi:porin family protein [Myroides guanonis]|uniref:Long-chain fatty acid transport protein n=1 Tax=Myroides guanonis TaxID=1150112 RepID=A0A1I3NP51_9FLAO|nr:hypothetical protein [Myroides guanonis]SFJ11061.1 hypothetical protein SAMN04487893_103153 [Myroides guanonis]
MIKKIFLSLSLLVGTTAIAQQGTASPYSFYGVGDINSNNTNEYKAMGGMSVYSDSIHINLNNPASYSKLKLTTFSIGTTFKNYTLKSSDATEKANRASIDYLALGLPLGKFGVSFGLLPYSATGYKINSLKEVNGQKHSTQFNGDGGINKVFAGVAYSILPNLQFGIDMGYNFGQIDNKTTVFVIDNGDDYFIPNGTSEVKSSEYSGVTINTGLQYSGKLKNYDWSASLTYSPETKLNTNNRTVLSIINYNNTVLERKTTEENTIKTINPSSLSAGLGIGKEHKWFVGAEFTQTQTNKLNQNNVFKNANYEDSQRYSIGGFYIPKYNSFTSYFDRIVYRGGFRYENTGLILNDQAINDYAFSLGAGFPIGRNLTNLNIGVEYGQKGTNKNNLIKENYFNLSVGVSLNDLWFVKRKFE